MNDIFETSVFFGAVISLLCYGLGVVLHNKTSPPIYKPPKKCYNKEKAQGGRNYDT